MGLEPTTAGATIQSSTYLSYGHHRTRTVSIANALSVVNSPFSLLPLAYSKPFPIIKSGETS